MPKTKKTKECTQFVKDCVTGDVIAREDAREIEGGMTKTSVDKVEVATMGLDWAYPKSGSEERKIKTFYKYVECDKNGETFIEKELEIERNRLVSCKMSRERLERELMERDLREDARVNFISNALFIGFITVLGVALGILIF